MFTINDFLRLMKYFKTGEIDTDLDNNLVILAEDSKAKSTTLFLENIDMTCFMSDDYKRLRKFLITWYASLRTFSSVMKNAKDVRSMPEEHLNELIRSFGFTESLGNITHQNKIDFFYDLVNLLKIKGTPESVIRVLSYFGIPNIELIEYWLQYDESGNLVFRPQEISTEFLGITPIVSSDVSYETITDNDPHWFLTKDQINELFLINRIAFPSKTRYFGIRPTSELIGSSITPVMAILTRMVLDQYDDYIGGATLTKDINIDFLNTYGSLLDLYLSVVYTFQSLYDIDNSSALSTLIYNGSMSLTNAEIIDLFIDLTDRNNLDDYEDVETNRALYDTNFSKLRSENFLTLKTTAEDVLTLTNPTVKVLIDSYLSTDEGEFALKRLLQILSDWVSTYISEGTSISTLISPSNISNLILGFSSLDYLTNVINFFKPYSARLILVEHIYTINDPLHDVVIPKDVVEFDTTDTFVDFDTADSNPCIFSDSTATEYSRITFDCGSFFDIGASCDYPTNDIEEEIEETIYDHYNYHTEDSTSTVTYEIVSNAIVYDGDNVPVSLEVDHTIYMLENDPDNEGFVKWDIHFDLDTTLKIYSDGNWTDFDCGGVMDAPQICDSFSIELLAS